MFQTVVSVLGSAFVEIVILVLMLVYFFTQRKDPRLVASGIRLVHTIIVVMIFSYFMLVWASVVETSLRGTSVFGMFLVNLYFIFNLILARFERPYRDALAGLNQEPRKPDILNDVWRTGRRFYHLRYFMASLFSGKNPLHFLSEIATDRVRDDIRDELHRFGVERKLITLPVLAGYLKDRLASDENLPADFKEMMSQTIDNFGKHPWVEEQVNEFLRIVAETPEDLHFPEWMSQFDSFAKP